MEQLYTYTKTEEKQANAEIIDPYALKNNIQNMVRTNYQKTYQDHAHTHKK